MLTLSDYKPKIDEIISQIGQFNYSSIDHIPINPNRIFIPFMKIAEETDEDIEYIY